MGSNGKTALQISCRETVCCHLFSLYSSKRFACVLCYAELLHQFLLLRVLAKTLHQHDDHTSNQHRKHFSERNLSFSQRLK